MYVMLQKYLQSQVSGISNCAIHISVTVITQSRVWPFIIVGALANIINVILHSILLLWLDLGIL